MHWEHGTASSSASFSIPALAQGHWAIQPEKLAFSQPIARHFHLFKWAPWSAVIVGASGERSAADGIVSESARLKRITPSVSVSVRSTRPYDQSEEDVAECVEIMLFTVDAHSLTQELTVIWLYRCPLEYVSTIFVSISKIYWLDFQCTSLYMKVYAGISVI